MQWEYMVTEDEEYMGQQEAQKYLDEKGNEGWELIHVSQSMRTFIMKREKRNENEKHLVTRPA